jgi:hypothetical protein
MNKNINSTSKPSSRATWNRLIAIHYNTSLDHQTRVQAHVLLNQLNTAGGKELMEHEAISFCNRIEQTFQPTL